MPDSGTAYRQLLEEALELGRADGRFAAAFEPMTAPRGDRCLGRTAEEFARLLWEGRPGAPPAGLVLNASHWYAAGYDQGLADGRARSMVRALSLRRVVS